MKFTPIIHIGYGKTGTTWFQKRYYPKITGIIYLSRSKVLKFLKYIHSPNFSMNIAKSNLLVQLKGRFVICEETILMGNLKKIKHTAKTLQEVIPDGHIIIFIRNQADMIASKYLQYIKEGGTYTVNKFLWGKETNPISRVQNFKKRFQKLQYHQIIEIFTKYFSKENVSIFLFEEFKLDNKEFIDNFSRLFSFSTPKQINFREKNIGYRNCLMSLARFINYFSKNKRKRKDYYIHIPFLHFLSMKFFSLINYIPIFGKRLNSTELLGQSNILFIQEYFKKSNNILYTDYNLQNIKKYNYPL